MVSRINYIFCTIIVLSDINRSLCNHTSDKLEKQSEIDLDGIINSFFPNLNQGDGNNSGGDRNPPSNNQNQVNSPQGNSWNNANANPGINYPGNSQLYPGQNSQGDQPQMPGHIENNGINPGSPQQVNQQQYPGNMGNNGVYPGSLQQGSNNQRYPGNGFNGNLASNPGSPNLMQGSNPQYPGNGLNNGNPNYHYPGNPNVLQGINPQYPTEGDGLSHINTRPGINYPTYPSDSNQGNYVQYPGMGNNWNNNRNPGHYQNGPSLNERPQGINPQYPTESDGLSHINIRPGINYPTYPSDSNQNQFTGTNWNNANGLQNNPNQIGAGNQQAHGFNQNPIIQGQPPRYPDGYQNYNPEVLNGFPSQDANGLNNQFNGNFQDPNRQYPQLGSIVTTEKVDILGNPIVMSTIRPPVFSTTSAMKQCVQDCPTTSEYNPVCGNNNITYFNKGKFDCARRCGIDVKIIRNGTCAPATGINRQAGVYA